MISKNEWPQSFNPDNQICVKPRVLDLLHFLDLIIEKFDKFPFRNLIVK